MKTYSFKVVVEPDERGYHAFCPALRRFGAVTQGATEEEADASEYEQAQWTDDALRRLGLVR